VGKVKVVVDGATVATYALYPAADVPAGGFFRRLIDSMRLWFA
jgi:D-alanyl-D-alanine carboxypeptidase (penicillin-binding protein 5/6)